ncbi:MAG: UDP-N-acetylmuramoyl-L-alanyl-D-glutamate--2,6-diaminopimelate ligase [Lachnospiraceae bacterium]|nr:UDP-N-acetylmuramoyl-L-alanyl-D-glutamate--2,6-diaminopimelate ligase [Lachnospiraceae bacterium]
MYKLSELLKDIDYTVQKGGVDITVSDVTPDSRKAGPGSFFICISGFKSDGHSFIPEVVKNGASAILIEKDIDLSSAKGATVIRVPDARYAMAHIAAAYYGYPAKKLRIIGITGTKGKTTTAYLTKAILERGGFKTGLIGTIEVIIGDEHIPASNTTPDSFVLQGYFRKMADAGIRVVVMEAASQGFKLKRTEAVPFEIGIFTNLEEDHIGPNEHASFEEYLECKSMLFRQCRIGIVNADDAHVLKIIKNHTCEIETYGFNPHADYYAEKETTVHEPGRIGMEFDLCGRRSVHLSIPNPGRFSIYNALAAASAAFHFGITEETVRDALYETTIKGRIETVPTPYDFTLLIDYAHNAMSLESILTTLREYEPNRLICLFGCGGNRSRERRFSMGEVSGRLADLTIITSDNPRDEEPGAIIGDIRTGIEKTDGKYVEIIDRKDAIRYAIRNGRRGDIIVLAGKGHEDYQEIRGVKYPMDERVLIREILSEA